MPKILIDNRGRNEKSVCDYHRIYLPYLRGDSFDTQSNLFIFNGVPTHGPQSIKRLRKEGFKIVMDLDDSLRIPEHHMLYPYFQNGLRDDLIWLLRNSDIVLTTTEVLAEEFSVYNKNVFVVPNGLPFDEEGFTLSVDKYSKTPFVWAGSETHKEDLKELPDLGSMLTLCGYKSETIEPVSYNEWNIIRNDIMPNAIFEAHRGLDHYMQAYDGHEIALAPLKNEYFNHAKSNLKVLEAAAKGLPIICSDINTYKDKGLSDYVMYAKDKDSWVKATQLLYANPDLASEMGKDLAQYARKHFHINKMNDIRRDIFRSI